MTSKNEIIREWSTAKKWNPFNSNKLFSQVYRWKEIKRGKQIPPPNLVTVDPTNLCDLKCKWCNSEYIIRRNQGQISEKTLNDIADFLPDWNTHPRWKGVETVCIAGGGEPLLNPHTGKFIRRLSELGIESGVVTNGTQIDKYLEDLAKCTWVGVSVDASLAKTFQMLKGVDLFAKVIKNMGKLIDYAEKNNTRLGKKGQGHGVSYKFLLHPQNVGEVYQAAKIAKDIGCRNFHIRPFGISWDKLGKPHNSFTHSHIKEFRKQLDGARELEDENFGVFGITHKFDGDFRKSNSFRECYAIFMTGVFMPPSNPGHDGEGFNFGLCCDRRGDKNLTLKDLRSPHQVSEFWGSEKHWSMFDKITVKGCPRCTYQPHNEIFENAIKQNNMTYNFI